MRTAALIEQAAWIIRFSAGIMGCGAQDDTCLANTESPCEPDADSTEPAVDGSPLEALDANVNLSIGSGGADVRAVQDRLRAYGYFPNRQLAHDFPAWRPIVESDPAENGVYDELTATAVREFQARNGLEPTGNADSATLALLAMARCGVPDGIAELDPAVKYDAFNGNGIWDDGTVSWRVISADASGPSAPDITTVAQAAFNSWEAVTYIDFTFEPTGGVDIEIRSVTNISGLADAAQPDDATTGNIRINADDFDWSTDGTPAGTEFDLETVLLHEIGHAIGLRHSSVAVATMEPITDMGVCDGTLNVDDTVAASALYDVFVGVSGQANDIALGSDGSVWIIGNTSAAGGFVVRKWNSSSFVSVADGGSGMRIAVAPNGRPWVVADNGSIWRRTSSSTSSATWDAITGCANDIGIGGTGTGAVWVVGCNAESRARGPAHRCHHAGWHSVQDRQRCSRSGLALGRWGLLRHRQRHERGLLRRWRFRR